MSKFRVLFVGATAAGAFAAASFIPAFAADAPPVHVDGVGTLTIAGDPATQTGHITADGEIDEPSGHLDGYITAGNDGVDAPADAGVCADDNGSNANPYDATTNPGGSDSPDCNENIILSQLP
jgi:hypothetical protein